MNHSNSEQINAELLAFFQRAEQAAAVTVVSQILAIRYKWSFRVARLGGP